MSEDQLRNKLARDRGYPNYHYAHDAIRQEIDDEIGLMWAAADLLRQRGVDGATYDKLIALEKGRA